MLPRGIDASLNPVLSILLSTFFSWWANFKILALCWDRGPLSNFCRKKRKKNKKSDSSEEKLFNFVLFKEYFVLYFQFTTSLILPIVILPSKKKVRAEKKVHSVEAKKPEKKLSIVSLLSNNFGEDKKLNEEAQKYTFGEKLKNDFMQFGDMALEKAVKEMGAPMRLILGDLSGEDEKGENNTKGEKFSTRDGGLKEKEEEKEKENKKTKEDEEETAKEEEEEEDEEEEEELEAEEEGEKLKESYVTSTRKISHFIVHSVVHGNNSWQFLGLQALGSLVLFSLLIYLTDLRIWMSDISLSLLYCLIMYTNLLYMFNFSAAFMKGIWGVSLSPDFKRPYFSTSLQDFWSRRWNLVASQLLRDAIYSPLKQFILEEAKDKSGFPKIIGSAIPILVAFFVSGGMHELILYNACGHLNGLSFEWLSFFSLHGILLVLELGLKKLWAQKGFKKLPSVVSIPLTLSILVATAQVYFFPPVMRHDFDRFAIGEFRKLLPGQPFESFTMHMSSLQKEEL